VAGHMFRMGVMGLLYSHKNKDTIRFNSSPFIFHKVACHVLRTLFLVDLLQFASVFWSGAYCMILLFDMSCSVADPDPGSGAFLTPGSGLRDEQPGSYFLELRKHFLG